jgi:hypothetical protein
MGPYITLLRRNPGYRRLWLAGAVSLFGDWFNVIVIMALVARLSGNSGLAWGMVLRRQSV